MGLDMYLYTKDKEGKEVEVTYWRKHPNLHGYIEQLYRERGGSEEFNCIEFELEKEDLENILKNSKENTLPKTTGFFFGESCEEDNEQTIEVMKKAIKLVNEGEKIFYNSWW